MANLTVEDLNNGKTDLDTLSEISNSKDVSTGLFKLQTTTRLGDTVDTNLGVQQKMGGVYKGDYSTNPTLEYIYEYALDTSDKSRWQVIDPNTLPYTIDSATYPDPDNDPNLKIFSDLNINNLGDYTDITFSSVADMISGKPVGGSPGDISLSDGQKAVTLGYYAEGDGGNGEYLTVAAATGTPDSGSFFDLNNGKQAKLIHDGEVNALQFGVKDDGSNQKTSFNDAFSIASKVVANDKTFSADGLLIPDNVEFTGSATIKHIDGSTDILLSNTDKINGNSNIHIHDLVFDGNKANVVDEIVIQLFKCDNSRIASNEVLNPSNFGIDVQGGTTNHVVVESNRVLDGNGSGIDISGVTGDGNKIINNTVTGCQASGIVVQGNASEVVVNGNTSNGNGLNNGNGISAGNSSQCVISNNICNDNSNAAEAGSGIGLNPSLVDCLGHTVTGNICRRNGDDGVDIAAASGKSSKYHTITGNSLVGNINSGVNIGGSGDVSYNTIMGNNIQGNGQAGIQIDSAATRGHNTITGNSVISNNGSDNPSGAPGIRAIDSHNVIIGNTLDNDIASGHQGGISLSGASQVCIGNLIRDSELDPISIVANNDHIVSSNFGSSFNKESSSFPTLSGTSPDVGFGKIFHVSNGSPTTINAFTGGMLGQQMILIFLDGNTTLAHGTGIRLSGGLNFTPNVNDAINLIYNGTGFTEIGRGDN